MIQNKSDLWKHFVENLNFSKDFLLPTNKAAVGLGFHMYENDEKWFELYKDSVEMFQQFVDIEELLKYPISEIGSPQLLTYEGYTSTASYLHNFVLAKNVIKFINIEKPRILEIGAGYGGMADILMRMIDVEEYSIADLDEVLPFSEYYLRSMHQNKKLNFYSGTMLPEDGKFDFVINTFSFGEMPNEIAINYIDYAMKHSKYLISHNGVQRTSLGVKKHSEYGFHNYHIEHIYPQPVIPGAFHDGHIFLKISHGKPNLTAKEIDKFQQAVNLGLHEDLKEENKLAVNCFFIAFKMPFSVLQNFLLKLYLRLGKSVLAKAYASILLNMPFEAPDYLKKTLSLGGKKRVLSKIKKALEY